MTDQLALDLSARPDPARNAIGRFPQGARDTALAAAIRVAPRSGTQRAAVLEAITRSANGVTDYELWELHRIGARPHVPATRREELIADGWPIIDSGQRRSTDTGSPAIVWTLKESA